MSTNFPTSVDALVNPAGTDSLTSPSHSAQHTNANDAIEAIETYLIEQEVDYAEITSNVTVTATTSATATTIVTGAAKTYDGEAKIRIDFFSPLVRPSGTVSRILTFVLYDGSTELGRFGGVTHQVTGVLVDAPVHLSRRFTPAAGTRTYSIRAYNSAGADGLVAAGGGASGAFMPAYMQITRVR